MVSCSFRLQNSGLNHYVSSKEKIQYLILLDKDTYSPKLYGFSIRRPNKLSRWQASNNYRTTDETEKKLLQCRQLLQQLITIQKPCSTVHLIQSREIHNALYLSSRNFESGLIIKFQNIIML